MGYVPAHFFRGYYATQAALEAAVPVGDLGDYAIVGSTDTVWIWDGDGAAWVDSGGSGSGDFSGPDGGVVDGDLVLFDGISGKMGKGSAIPASRVFRTDGTALPIANLPMSGYRLTGLGAPVDLADSARFADVKSARSLLYGSILSAPPTWANLVAALTAYENDWTARMGAIAWPLTGGTITPGAGLTYTGTKPVRLLGSRGSDAVLSLINNGIGFVFSGEYLGLSRLGIVKGHTQHSFTMCGSTGMRAVKVDILDCPLTDNSGGGAALFDMKYRVDGEILVRGGSINYGYATLVTNEGNAAAWRASQTLIMEAVPVTLSGNARLVKNVISGSTIDVYLRSGTNAPANAFEAQDGAIVRVYYDDTCDVTETGVVSGTGSVVFVPVSGACLSNKVFRGSTGGDSNLETAVDTINNGVGFIGGTVWASGNLALGATRTVKKPLRIVGGPGFGATLNMNVNGAVYTMHAGRLEIENMAVSVGAGITNGGFQWLNGYSGSVRLVNSAVSVPGGPAPFRKELRGALDVELEGGSTTVADGRNAYTATGSNWGGEPCVTIKARGHTVTTAGTGRFLKLTYQRGRAFVWLSQGCTLPANAIEAVDGTRVDVFYDGTCNVAEEAVTDGTGAVVFHRTDFVTRRPMLGMVEGGALARINTYSTVSYAIFNGGRVWDPASNAMVDFAGATFGSAISYVPGVGQTTVVAVNVKTHALTMVRNWEERSEASGVLVPLWQMTFSNAGGFYEFTGALDARTSFLRNPISYGPALMYSETSTGGKNRMVRTEIDPDTHDIVVSAEMGSGWEELWRFRLDFGGTKPTALVVQGSFEARDGISIDPTGVTGGVVSIGGVQVVGPQGSPVADPSGGSTVDSEARTAIGAILSALRAHGLIETV